MHFLTDQVYQYYQYSVGATDLDGTTSYRSSSSNQFSKKYLLQVSIQ